MNWLGAGAAFLARRRLERMRALAAAPRAPQVELFAKLRERFAATAFGRAHDLASVRTHTDWCRAVPLMDYAAMAPWWRRARAGERDVTWPGLIRHWALSSGTTSGEKFLPVSDATIANNRRGGFDSLVPHLAQAGGALFGGKLLFLGGSTALRREGDVWIGDNTGIMAREVPRLLNGLYAPSAAVRAMTAWQQKMERAAAETATADLRMLAGVPSWIVLFGEAALAAAQRAGRDVATLGELWPNLQLFVHGGVSFEPYRRRVDALIGRTIRCTDTYSASEGGMLAVQDRDDDPGMLPLLDRATFFEFVPREDLGAASPRRLLAHEVEPGVDYAVALTTDSGIAAYLVGDLVRFTSREPLRLCFAGRTAHTLSAFGEHVSSGELDRAIAAAADATGAVVDEFTVAVRYPDHRDAMGQHRWLVEFRREPADPAQFAAVLDRTITDGNEDYATHRSYGLREPAVVPLPRGTFLGWMQQHGKFGGQHKVPRVASPAMAAELDADARGALSES
ncbi:MAG: GH3 auxin-responsive promoter family protein [Planctomycetes bacterium]|nr:GH3 auxin-responsive promoter family protein [Planctomycetota bacterium]